MSEQLLTAKIRSGEKSRHGVSLVVHQDRLYVAWTGTDNNLNVMYSTDGGRSFDSATKQIIYEQSYARPALASYRDRLYLAWAGTDRHLNMVCSNDGGSTLDKATKWYGKDTSISHEQMLHDNATNSTHITSSSYPGPALAVYNEPLHIIWTGSDARLNVMASTDSGRSFNPSTKQTLKNYSNTAPALAVFRGVPTLAWSRLGTMNLSILSASDREFSVADAKNAVDTRESAQKAPALTVYHDQLYVAWIDGWSEEWGGSINLAVAH